MESNPYSYKLVPGKEKEAFAPSYLELLKLVSKLLASQGLLSKEEEQHIKVLEDRLQKLIEGNFVGTPRRRL